MAQLDGLPDEIVQKFEQFSNALEHAKQKLSHLMSLNIGSADLSFSPLEKAKLNLTCGYALNSLFWMYLSTLGMDPKKCGMTQELEQYKEYMLKVQSLTGKKNEGPKLDREAAKRFIRGALWKPKNKENEEEDDLPHTDCGKISSDEESGQYESSDEADSSDQESPSSQKKRRKH